MTAAVIATADGPARDGRFTQEVAREMGLRSGRARQKLNLARVERELPPFSTPGEIRQGCELIQRWTCAGLLNGTAAGAAVRAAEIGLRTLEAATTFEAIEALRADVQALRAERDRLVRVSPPREAHL